MHNLSVLRGAKNKTLPFVLGEGRRPLLHREHVSKSDRIWGSRYPYRALAALFERWSLRKVDPQLPWLYVTLGQTFFTNGFLQYLQLFRFFVQLGEGARLKSHRLLSCSILVRSGSYSTSRLWMSASALTLFPASSQYRIRFEKGTPPP